jgi:hypothetical protein
LTIAVIIISAKLAMTMALDFANSANANLHLWNAKSVRSYIVANVLEQPRLNTDKTKRLDAVKIAKRLLTDLINLPNNKPKK